MAREGGPPLRGKEKDFVACLTADRPVCILRFVKRNAVPTSEARQRIVETADRLFYKDGIHAVGIDRVIAEAGVAKATLYKHFRSKDELILAALQHREHLVLEFYRTELARHDGRPKEKLRALFNALKDRFASPGYRGCAMQNAALELANPAHPASKFVREYKRRFVEMIRGVVEEAAGKEAARLAPAIALLFEGAIVTAVIQGDPEAARVARDTALRLVEGAKAA